MAYTRKITPLMGERHWPLKDLPLDPPPIKIGPERPKQIEQKILKDPKSSQDRFQMYFSICKSGDHTKKKCTTRTNHIEEPQPKQEGGQRNNFHILITLMHHIMKLLLNLVMEAGGEDEIEGEIKAGEREIKTEEMFMEVKIFEVELGCYTITQMATTTSGLLQ